MISQRYVGIDYSGADLPNKKLSGIQVYEAVGSNQPIRKQSDGKRIMWSREDVYHYVENITKENVKTIIGIDHGFSFPKEYFESPKNNLTTWGQFLTHFENLWNTRFNSVDTCKNKINPDYDNLIENKFRLIEKYNSSAKHVLDISEKRVGQGNVSYSTHAGIPWIAELRKNCDSKIHFWPFDGYEISEEKNVVIAEVYPAIFHKRFESLTVNLTEHARDALVIACWLQERDNNNTLAQYLLLKTLDATEKKQIALEGWVLGVL
ncbi:hypothetical protein [Paenibacillus oryzisoli]|uniref:DUF429 domain-containing protein n=1 Tax=Paenibacillus oryzisoli TaxID=1850517 RepID=A0A197ZXN6_9BACL|nr:hypothetical protein [Paenibacillus oryzisoli]OAS13745.1 hypothetical protein A8708_25225 [Paenibacillus oryzisoli]